MRLRPRQLFRWSGYVLAGAVPATYAWYVKETDDYLLEGACRGLYFWSRVGPIILHYKWTDQVTRNVNAEERDAAFQGLHSKYAPVAFDVILKLRGFYVKSGQFGSARPDIMPAPYLHELRKLQDELPHEDIGYVHSTIEACLKLPIDEVFSEFGSTPLGAASIGQAHWARLRSNGTEVVVKVQYPSVRRTFSIDMSCIRTVLSIAEPSLEPVLDELKKQFLTEFDYRGEAHNLTDVANNVLPLWGDRIAIPTAIPELCGEHVLTMTYLPGEKLETVLKREWQRLGFTEKDLQMKLSAGTAAAPSPRKLSFYLRLLRWFSFFKDVQALSSIALKRCFGSDAYKQKQQTEHRIPDRDKLLRTLLGVHAQQVLVDGVFNADLHPGNFLLLPDGRLGLIDFGQVKRIDAGCRLKLAQLIVAVAKHDREGIVAAMTDIGVRSAKMNPQFLEANAKLLFDRIDGELTGGKSLIQFAQTLRSMDTLTVMPGELYLPSRAATMLRGLSLLLYCDVSIADEWKSAAELVISESSKRP